MMNCQKVMAKCSDIIDNEANLAARLGFFGHLIMCQNCQRYFNQFKRVKEMIGKVGQEDNEADIDPVMSAVLEQIERGEK